MIKKKVQIDVEQHFFPTTVFFVNDNIILPWLSDTLSITVYYNGYR